MILQYLQLRFLLVCLSAVLVSCEDSRINHRNPYLQDVSFTVSVNTALPEYNDLGTIGGSVYISNGGIRGILLVCKGTNDYLAWEASCPNHPPNTCSTMKLQGTSCTCPCDNYIYSLFTGNLTSAPKNDGKNIQGLLFYRAVAYNGVITISN